MEITKQFGIEPVLLLAQIVNFLVIILVLKKFFFKPIVKVLEDRKARIEESLKNADLIEERLQKTQEQTQNALREAREGAKTILHEAKTEAQRMSDAALTEARKTHELAITSAQEQIQIQREEMKKQLEKETLTLVAEVVKKVLGRSLSQKEKSQLAGKSMSEITRNI